MYGYPWNSSYSADNEAETVADYAADVDTPVADYADAGAEAPVDAPTAANDDVPADA